MASVSNSDHIPLYSFREGYIRIYSIVSPGKNEKGYGYGIVAPPGNVPLPHSIERHQANLLAINAALKLATDLASYHTRIEIFLTNLSALYFALSPRRLNKTDVSSLHNLLNIQSQADISYGIEAEAEGPKLASSEPQSQPSL